MPGPVEIANVALGMIGEPSITSFNDDLASARAANLRFPTVRDAVLRAHVWNFAKARQQLAKLAQNPPFGYDAQFQLPADWLRMVEVNPGPGVHPSPIAPDYKIEGQRLLLNGSDTAQIIYIRRETDTTKWDALATEAFAARLASELAVAITQNRTLAQQLFDQYQVKLAEARSVDAMDEPAPQIEADEWIASRIHNPTRFFGDL